MNSTTQKTLPSKVEIEALAALCSTQEWDHLITSHGFLEAASTSVAAMENLMTQRLGRKISVGGLSVKNPGDETL